MPDDDPPRNPFVRWKKHVDERIGAGLNSVLGIPSVLSKNFHLPPPPSQPSTTQPSNTPQPDSSVSDQVQQLRRLPCPRAHESANMSDIASNRASASVLADFIYTINDPAYSPLTLDRHLPPPFPRGVPDDLNLDPESDFTYRDAYEDLLRVSTGLPLAPFSVLAARKSDVRRMYGIEGGETPLEWLERISNEGLVSRMLEHPAQRNCAMDGDEARKQEELGGDPFAALTKLWSETGNPFRSNSGNTFGRDVPTGRDEEVDDLPRNIFTELSRAVRMVEQVFEEEVERRSRPTVSDAETRRKPRNMPDTEAEMYEMLREVFSGGASLSALVRAAMDASTEHRGSATTSWKSEPTSRQGESGTVDGTRTVRTTEEHTDEDGNHHAKVVVQRLNAAGEEISKETRHTVQSGSKSCSAGEDGSSGENSKKPPQFAEKPSKERTSDGSHNSGWFWR